MHGFILSTALLGYKPDPEVLAASAPVGGANDND